MRAALLVTLTGCARLFELDPPDRSQTDGGQQTSDDDPGVSDAKPPAPPCRGDNFDDGTIDTAMWTVVSYNRQHVAKETGGRFEIRFAPNIADLTGLRLTAPLDLQDRSIEIEIAQPPAGNNVDMYMSVVIDTDHRATMRFYNGQIQLTARVGTHQSTNISGYQPVAHRYWRMKFDAATERMTFMVGSNGTTWQVQQSVDWTFATAYVELISGTFSSGDGNLDDHAAFDNFRIVDPDCI